MSTPLAKQCFEQGVMRGFLKASALGKSATSASAARVAMSALRKKELAALGEKLFRESGQYGNALGSLKATVLPGYGQLRAVKQLIRSYPRLYQSAAPQDREMVKRLFRQQLEQSFTDIGQVAEPKVKFWRTTAPAAAGGTAGMGLGLAGGAAGGAVERQRANEQRLRAMPLWDRMKYLLLPQSLNIKPELPYELRSTRRRELPNGI